MRSSERRPVCINVISFCPTSQTPAAATPADTYLRRHKEYIFKSSANIFLNVLQMYFCKVFLFMICALQLQNLKSNAKMGIDDTNYLILNSFHCTVFIFHSIVMIPSIFDSVSLSQKVACICSPGKRFLFYI